MTGKKEKTMSDMIDNEDYTKISISKKWKDIIKNICKDTGLKMYHFEDRAIENFIKTNYPQYIKK